MKKIRRFFERVVEGGFLLSSTVTTLAVFFIIFFLFKEGLGVFNERPTEPKYVLVAHSSNKVDKLTSLQVKDIYDQNITNWKALGGANDSILLFSLDDLLSVYTEEELGPELEYVGEKINDYISERPGIIAFIPVSYIPAKEFSGKEIILDRISIKDFFLGREWFPTAVPAAQFGVLPLILGTLWVSLFAILFALPIGLVTAIYMAEVAHPNARRILKPLIELLAGIPSVVYGFFGLVVLVPLIQKVFNLPVGETALAGSLILAVMALPTIITISEDALRTMPVSLKEASLAMGASRFQTLVRVTIPYAKSGIIAASILGIGRAMGETMAVLMVTGNASIMPESILEPVRTIPATIAAELGEAPHGGVHYKALFALGIILFVMTFGFNLIVASTRRKNKAA